MKKYAKKEYVFYEYHFNSLDSFLAYIQDGTTNTRVFNEYDLSSMKGDYEFTKTESLDEAIRLCKCGWNEEFDKLLELKKQVDEKFLRPDTSLKRTKDYVGFAPSVPDYLKGNPKNMWRLQRRPNFRIIQIYVNISYYGYTSITSIYNRGAILLSLIDVLEKAGYAVNLVLFECSYYDDEVIIPYFNLKEESSNLNLKKLYFPLCHPSFLRRLIFRLEEITPVHNKGWEYSYGRIFKRNNLIELLELDISDVIVFTTPADMGISGDNIYEDLENVLEKIEFDKYLKLQ